MMVSKLSDRSATEEADVVVIGAGPTGLMTANLLGRYGARVVVVEAGSELIDYPRGVGMDDETLRTFQNAGLVDEVLEHTIPHQLLVFVDRKRRDLARMAPPMADFGWPRRNGFVQPLADLVLLGGAQRYDNVRIEWGTRVTGFEQDAEGVTVTTDDGDRVSTLRCRYLVAADGGRSQTRKDLGLSFEGSTARADWLVIDVRDDPLGQPGAYVGADRRRPYASISIPHGIRRFELMLLPGETEADTERPEFIAQVLEPFVPRGSRVDIIRQRVYSHNSRIAGAFRVGRIFLAGDAAHLMAVWQGQGYNSGIRDAFNLSWKLALALRGQGGEALLDSYDLERRDHVAAMIQLSKWVGSVISIRNRVAAGLRDAFFHGISRIPRMKNYIVQMRFKPMPTMTQGALTLRASASTPSPVGRLFIQPDVVTREGARVRLDDAIGPWFALITWNNDPRALLDADALARLDALGVRLVAARPAVQLHWEGDRPLDPDTVVVGDADGTLKNWFDARPDSVVLVRPDRIVAGASPAFGTSDMVRGFAAAIEAPAPTSPAVSTRKETAR
jgi:3-(3-hydroxy-phenyl)propionate hydroxylase